MHVSMVIGVQDSVALVEKLPLPMPDDMEAAPPRRRGDWHLDPS